MLDVKEAVQSAVTNLKQLYDGQTFSDLLLEEVERTEEDRYWNITLGFSIPETGSLTAMHGVFATLSGKGLKRVYKRFKIDAENGSMKSMTIRQL